MNKKVNKNKTCIVNCNKSYRELPFQLSTEKLHMLLFFSIIQCDSFEMIFENDIAFCCTYFNF